MSILNSTQKMTFAIYELSPLCPLNNDVDNGDKADYSGVCDLTTRYEILRSRMILKYYKNAGWLVTFNVYNDKSGMYQNLAPYQYLVSTKVVKDDIIRRFRDTYTDDVSLIEKICDQLDEIEKEFGDKTEVSNERKQVFVPRRSIR
jgi:hypothetical protein